MSGKALLLPEVQTVLERLHTLADARDDVIVQEVRGDEGPGRPPRRSRRRR